MRRRLRRPEGIFGRRGQVLDYVHVAREHGIAAQPAIFLPDSPSGQLQQLLRNLGIVLIVLSDEGEVTVSEPNSAS